MTGIRSSRPSASGVQKANSGSSCRKASPASQTIRKERSLDFLWADEPHGEGARVKPILAAGLENRKCFPTQTDSKPNCSARRASAARSSPRRWHKKLHISFFHLLVFYAHLGDSLA